MDKKRSVLNIVISILGKFVILVFMLLTRRLIISCLGNEINGINSLYTSIIGFLAVAELGVGSAIIFSMYKPIVENDVEKTAALYQLYKKIYFVIGVIIGCLGVLIIPFLPILCKDYSKLDINLTVTFLLQLLSVLGTYFYSAKTSLINAYKNNYITSSCHVIGICVQSIVQIFVLSRFKSFELYLVANILGTVTEWFITSVIVRKEYNNVITYQKTRVDSMTAKQIIKNVKAMFLHKIGTVLVNSTDSIIISTFIGVEILGRYSNYTTLVTAMMSVIILFFTSLTSIIGHMFVKYSKKEIESWFRFFYYGNYFLGIVFFLGFYSIANSIITILFGQNLGMEKIIVATVTVNYFVQFMRQAALLFRDASGTFYYDRWKPLIEGICNLILSLVFVCVLDDRYKIVGVLLATIITNVFICHCIEPFVIYKYAFEKSVKKFMIENYMFLGSFIVLLSVLDKAMVSIDNVWISLVVNGCISLVISSIAVIGVLLIKKEMRYKAKLMIQKRRGQYR